jgi:GNAT superfamily N-acetyltransferase
VKLISNVKIDANFIEELKKMLKLENLRLAWVDTILPSKILIAGIKDDGSIGAICGVRSALNILSLYVCKQFRGQGIGTQILEMIINMAQKQHLPFVLLTVSSDNNIAIHLYSKFGFKKIVYLKGRDLIVMMLPLHFLGKVVYMCLRVITLLLPKRFWTYISRRIHDRTTASTT